MQKFHLNKDFDKIASSWDYIVRGYRQIEDELKEHGKENSAKILTDGLAFDKVLNLTRVMCKLQNMSSADI